MAEIQPTIGRGIAIGDRTVTAVTVTSEGGLRSARRASVALPPGTIRGGRINHIDGLARAFEQVCDLLGADTNHTWVGMLPPNAVVQSFDVSGSAASGSVDAAIADLVSPLVENDFVGGWQVRPHRGRWQATVAALPRAEVAAVVGAARKASLSLAGIELLPFSLLRSVGAQVRGSGLLVHPIEWNGSRLAVAWADLMPMLAGRIEPAGVEEPNRSQAWRCSMDQLDHLGAGQSGFRVGEQGFRLDAGFLVEAGQQVLDASYLVDREPLMGPSGPGLALPVPVIGLQSGDLFGVGLAMLGAGMATAEIDVMPAVSGPLHVLAGASNRASVVEPVAALRRRRKRTAVVVGAGAVAALAAGYAVTNINRGTSKIEQDLASGSGTTAANSEGSSAAGPRVGAGSTPQSTTLGTTPPESTLPGGVGTTNLAAPVLTAPPTTPAPTTPAPKATTAAPPTTAASSVPTVATGASPGGTATTAASPAPTATPSSTASTTPTVQSPTSTAKVDVPNAEFVSPPTGPSSTVAVTSRPAPTTPAVVTPVLGPATPPTNPVVPPTNPVVPPTNPVVPVAPVGPVVAAPAPLAPATPAVPAPSPAVATGPTRHGVFLGGKLILQGKVPDRATADAIVAKATAVLGAGNVIDRYEIDPSVPVSKDGHVRIEDRILFSFESAELQPGHEQVLDLAAKALELNPQASAVVIGHTDSTGPVEVNQPLSEARAQSVADYLVAKGVDPDCVKAVGKADSEPVADNATADGRRLNRRIEVEFTNLLG